MSKFYHVKYPLSGGSGGSDMPRWRSRGGFSLAEMLVVISIISAFIT